MVNYTWLKGNMIPRLKSNTYGTPMAHWHFDGYWLLGGKNGSCTRQPEDTTSETPRDLQVTMLDCSSRLRDNCFIIFLPTTEPRASLPDALRKMRQSACPHPCLSMWPEFHLDSWEGKAAPVSEANPVIRSHTLENVSSHSVLLHQNTPFPEPFLALLH